MLLDVKQFTVKFLLTRELGRLAKWLRILGFDARYERSSDKAYIMMEALKEERVLVTRNLRFGSRHGGTLVFIRRDGLREQLKDLLGALHIGVDRGRFFRRCTLCNVPLVEVAKTEIGALVPAHVYETRDDFMRCPGCGRVYWKGTHWGNVEEVLKSLQSTVDS